MRLDLRADRTFTVAGQPVLLFVGAQNVGNRQNVAGYTWNRSVNTMEVNKQLGPVPVWGHDRVITVYGRAGDWKQRLSYSPAHEEDACLVVLNREGVVRWLYHGGFDISRSAELKALLASLIRPVER